MTDYLVTVFLGIVEGITEFLPISSTGHLLLAEKFLHASRNELFNVGIQAGAILAVVVIYWRRLLDFLTRWKEAETRNLLLKILAAFFITAVLGLLARKLGFHLDDSHVGAVTAAVLIGALLIFLAEKILRRHKPVETISWKIALIVGAAQVLAGVFSGTSRSAATIMVAMCFGASRMIATEFSFLLGIPTMFAASGYLLLKELKESGVPPTSEIIHVSVGFVVSGIVAFLVVKWLLHYLRSHTFTPFAWYRLALGIILLVWLLMVNRT